MSTVVIEETATKTLESARGQEEGPSTGQPTEASTLSTVESAAQEGLTAPEVMALLTLLVLWSVRLDDADLGDRLMVTKKLFCKPR
jgi:hypothetical protein